MRKSWQKVRATGLGGVIGRHAGIGSVHCVECCGGEIAPHASLHVVDYNKTNIETYCFTYHNTWIVCGPTHMK